VGLGYWALKSDDQVLFSDLSPQDAAAVTAELERQKVPYTVAEQGAGGATSILVDRRDVYKTRMKVMGKEIPLHGAVGFEIFNNSDFGMTEFAQRINYQRALQGELTRTILSLEEIRDARVLLALPEQGLFKQARSKATASVTLTLRQGRSLSPVQVAGMQRLVAAAVPGIAAADVTIIDQSGVALTRLGGEGEADASSVHLDLKRETEQYLTRKASEVLDRTLGPGQALASVDVTLDMDRAQTTTEDVVAPPGASGHAQTGVVVRERETLRETNPPLGGHNSTETAGGVAGGSSQREVEYAVGRRVANVISQPGSIRRIQVVAVVRRSLDAAQQEQLRRTVAASVGAVFDRGDAVVVQSMEAVTAPALAAPGALAAAVTPGGVEGRREAEASTEAPAPRLGSRGALDRALGSAKAVVLLLAAALLVFAAWAWSSSRRRARVGAAGPHAVAAPLSEEDRDAALVQVRAWMRTGETKRAPGGVH
jgi:flagellar M-ring protein FliF